MAVTDFMPVGRVPGAGVHNYVTLDAPFWLVRIVEGLEGSVTVRIRYRPTVDFARRKTRLTRTSHGIAAEGGPSLTSDVVLSVDGELAEGTVEL